jgi:hypothetical protein
MANPTECLHHAVFSSQVYVQRPRISNSWGTSPDKGMRVVTGFTVPFTINIDYFPSLMASAFSKSRAPPHLCHFPDNYKLSSRSRLISTWLKSLSCLGSSGQFTTWMLLWLCLLKSLPVLLLQANKRMLSSVCLWRGTCLELIEKESIKYSEQTYIVLHKTTKSSWKVI